jgi:tetratricopeptide (TPR) repeat protein
VACDGESACLRQFNHRQIEDLEISALPKEEVLARLKQIASAEESKYNAQYALVLQRVLDLFTGPLSNVPGAAALVLVAPEREIDCLEPECDDDGLLLGELEAVTVHDKQFEQSLAQCAWCFSGEVDFRNRPLDTAYAIDHSSGRVVAASAYFPTHSSAILPQFSKSEQYKTAVDIAASLDRGVVFARSKQGVVSAYPAAEVQWGRCLQVAAAKKDLESGENVELAVMLDNLGHGHLQKGNPHAAKQLHERALRIQEAHYGQHHVQVGVTLDNLGICYIQLGNPEKAKGLLERALQINERHFGPNHVQVAWSLDNLGGALRDLGELWRAKALHERALRIYRTEYGSDHAQLVQTLNNLGHAERGLGNPAAAHPFYQQALVICEREIEPDAAAVAVGYNNLGNAVREMGDVKEAKALYDRALKSAEAEFGPTHAEVGRTLNNLGLAQLELGNAKDAHTTFVRALNIFESHFGARNTCAAMSRINLATCLAVLRKNKEAKEHVVNAEASVDASAGAKANLEVELRAAAIRFAIGENARPSPQERWHQAESMLQDLLGIKGVDAVCARCKEGLIRTWQHHDRPDIVQWLQARGTARI